MPSPLIAEFNFDKFGKFISEFGRILFADGVFQREKYLFRGQGDSNYLLRSSFDRRFETVPLGERVLKYERLVNLLKEEFERVGLTISEHKALGLAQHYGIPTRLLDWSSSPLVAAYFAFHERITGRKPARHVSIWALDKTNSKIWNPGHGIEIVRLERDENAHATRQLGFATNLRTPDDTLETFVSRLGLSETALWKFNIGADDARAAFAFLDACNTRASELFGDTGGAARTALERLVLLEGL